MKTTIYTIIATVTPERSSTMETHELGSFRTHDDALARMRELAKTINARLSINLSFEE